MEQLIHTDDFPFPLDLSPFDFVATNCHTADEKVRIVQNGFWSLLLVRLVLRLKIGV